MGSYDSLSYYFVQVLDFSSGKHFLNDEGSAEEEEGGKLVMKPADAATLGMEGSAIEGDGNNIGDYSRWQLAANAEVVLNKNKTSFFDDETLESKDEPMCWISGDYEK